MGLFLLPQSGYGQAGVTGVRNVNDAGPPDVKYPGFVRSSEYDDKEDDSLDSTRGRLKLLRRHLSTPPGHVPGGEHPAYTWGSFQRQDWRYPHEDIVRSRLRILGEWSDSTDRFRTLRR